MNKPQRYPNIVSAKKAQKRVKITYEDGPITGVKWMDKQAVTAISTNHTGEMSTISRS